MAEMSSKQPTTICPQCHSDKKEKRLLGCDGGYFQEPHPWHILNTYHTYDTSAEAPFSNGLTDAQAERLAILLEELGEAQQAIGKILRHGYESFNPDESQRSTNRRDLAKELGDVQYAIDRLIGNDDIDRFEVSLRVAEKPRRIARYLHHQGRANG